MGEYNMTEKEKKEFEDKFWNSPLDEEEQWYEDHSDDFVPVENLQKERKVLIQAAKNTVRNIEKQNKKMFSLRLEQEDINGLKEIAKEQGLPYQSLIGSIVHRYINGTLVDISEVKKILVFQK